MAGIPNQKQNMGRWLPTTQVVDINKDNYTQLLVKLYQIVNVIALAVNEKDTALYIDQEIQNGQKWAKPQTQNSPNEFPYEAVFRMRVDTGQLPNTGTTATPHGIPFAATYTVTRIYGAATDHTNLDYVPLPYASVVLASTIQLGVDSTNVYITTGADWSSYDSSYVIIEYIKNT